MKIFLIDDHLSFCEGLVAAIKTIQPEYEFDYVSDAELVPSELVGRNKYDLIMTDLLMPGWGGVELIKYLNRNNYHTPVMVMSSIRDERTIQEVFGLGIVGYVPKSYSTQQIVDAIETCRSGELHVPNFLDRCISVSEAGTVKPKEPQTSDESQVKLTRRQAEILSLMDDGLSNQAIADKLFIGKSTVKTHISQIFKLFDVNNRIACLKAAKSLGALG